MKDQVPQQRDKPSAPEPLHHLINAALDAIKRARAAWFVKILITIVFGVAVFNAVLSWNHGQITRRAELVELRCVSLSVAPNQRLALPGGATGGMIAHLASSDQGIVL